MFEILQTPFAKRFKEQQISFAEVSNQWLSVRRQSWCEDHTKVVASQIENYLVPTLGQLKLGCIETADVLAILRQIEKQGHVHTAHRILGIVNQIFRFAIASGFVMSNPARDLSGTLAERRVHHHSSILKPRDIGTLVFRIRMEGKRTMARYALLFCAYNFCRSGEIRKARWKEINFKTREWTIPSTRMKMRREHIVPLSRQSIDLLHQIKQLNLSDEWIFPNSKGTGCLNANALLSCLQSLGYSSKVMTVHGFRAMASTLLNEMGFVSDIIEKSLAHNNQGSVRAIYNRAQWLKQRKRMMQIYADTLDTFARKVEKRYMKKYHRLSF